MLKLQQIEVGYGDSMVVRNASLRVNDNQVVCVIGRNGVGKTTILKTIIGILTPKKGSIFFKNENITSKSPSSRARKGIGYVPQGREIFPKLTVYENLLLGLEASTEKKKRIPEEIYQYFPILKEFAKRNGGDLSGGQQQQLAIARALVANPSFLLLDEPTEGIQPNIVAEIQEVIRTIKKKGQTSIILVEQNLEFAKNVADYIYVIDHGTVVYEGYAKDINEEKVKQYLSV
jgi:urea transport system ATP-binding protein